MSDPRRHVYGLAFGERHDGLLGVRPLAKAALRLYFEMADDVREVVAHHQPQRRKSPGLVQHLLSGGTGELVTQGLEVEAEDTVAETVVAMVAEIL